MAEATAKPKKKYDLGTGRRKTAVARVRVCEGTGKVSINGKELDAFFTETKDRNAVLEVLGDDRGGAASRDGRDDRSLSLHRRDDWP